MEKIKIDKKYDLGKKVVKFQKEKIEIKPYIDLDDASKIISVVISNYYSDNEDLETSLMASSKILYSYILAVADKMTNVETNKKDSLNNLINSGFVDFLKQNILNYDEILQSIYFAIEQKNNYDREKSFENFISKSIKEMKKILDDSNKDMDKEAKELTKTLEELKELKEKGLPKENKKLKLNKISQ